MILRSKIIVSIMVLIAFLVGVLIFTITEGLGLSAIGMIVSYLLMMAFAVITNKTDFKIRSIRISKNEKIAQYK